MRKKTVGSNRVDMKLCYGIVLFICSSFHVLAQNNNGTDLIEMKQSRKVVDSVFQIIGFHEFQHLGSTGSPLG